MVFAAKTPGKSHEQFQQAQALGVVADDGEDAILSHIQSTFYLPM